ncbi:uncharacterized protein LOC126920182 [Bombus affinis]|uniref:Uncharacterized protein LOC100647737 n=1 Tax=Bombus terrestris TaxID=30195 RepID=A0A9B7CX86_BOMTE|nr:uncharacterized protein LOC100647737 [Bombus terrestris]XP_050586152.1 uncharacterized protein LOC126920182 [Bombus affinis]
MRAPWLVLILARILELVLGDHVCHRNHTDISIPDQRSPEILSRRRRLTFPMGSTFVLTLSILQPIQIKLPSNWNLDFEFDVIWPIPQQENFRKKYHKKRPWMVKRRHRRELYATFETALNSRNLPGKQCILRTICEAKTLLSPRGVSFVEDVIRLILSNVERVKEVDSYDVAYRTKMPCDVIYPCPFSLLKLLLFNLYSDDLG